MFNAKKKRFGKKSSGVYTLKSAIAQAWRAFVTEKNMRALQKQGVPIDWDSESGSIDWYVSTHKGLVYLGKIWRRDGWWIVKDMRSEFSLFSPKDFAELYEEHN